MRPRRHPDGTNGARPEHGALARREFGLLALEEPAGESAVVEPQGSGDSPKDTTGTGDTDGREKGTGKRNRKCVILAHGHTEDR